MASIQKTTDKSGETVYIVTASGGRGRRVKRSWRPQEGWSARTIERELHKFAASLENELKSGETITRQEEQARKRQEEMERQKLKTLKQYGEGVFMPAKENTFSENSRASYQMYLDRHIYPVLGDYLLSDITPAMLSKLLLDFQKTHAHSSTVKLYNILNGLFKMAFLDDTIKINPMLKVSRPKPRKDEAPQEESEKAYTAEELSYILKCVSQEPLKWQCYVCLLADTGLRRGEAGALEWSDIDWAKGTVAIRRNIQYTSSRGVYTTTPKNGKSRVVDVGPDVLELLQRLRREQSEKAISRYVFTENDSPEVMHPQTPTRYFQKFGERYGVKDFHPHKLRHSSASIAITNGADVVSVSQRLGHSDTAVTLRMYAHDNEESMRRAGQVVRDALKAVK